MPNIRFINNPGKVEPLLKKYLFINVDNIYKLYIDREQTNHITWIQVNEKLKEMYADYPYPVNNPSKPNAISVVIEDIEM